MLRLKPYHLLLLLAMTGAPALADKVPQPDGVISAKANADITRAQDLVTEGRSKQDPQLMLDGARALLHLAPVGEDGDQQRAAALAILEEIKPLAAGKTELMAELEAIMRAQPGRAQCNWKWLCDQGGCRWVQSC